MARPGRYARLRSVAREAEDGLALVLMHCSLLVVVVVGPAIDLRNRTIGAFSILASLAICGAMLVQPRSRRSILMALVLCGSLASAICFALVTPEDVAPASYKGWWPQLIAQLWPHFDSSTVEQTVAVFGLTGRVPPNAVAFLSLCLPLVALCLCARHKSPPARVLWITVALVSIGPIVGSGSRTTTAGLVVGFGVLLLVMLIPRPRVVLVGSLALVLSVIAYGLASFRSDPNLIGRFDTWVIALHDVVETPFLESGYGSFPIDHPSLYNAHNSLIQTLVDFGPVGLAAVITATWWSVRAAGRSLRMSSPKVSEADAVLLGRVTLSCVTALFVSALADSLISMPVHVSDGGWVTVLVPMVPFVLAAPLRLGLVAVERSTSSQSPGRSSIGSNLRSDTAR